MVLPKFFLVSSRCTEAQMEEAQRAFALTPVDVALVARPHDVELAKNITERVTGIHRPIAIVADFPFPLQVVMDDGSVVTVSVDAPSPLETETNE
jgi:hypothetical protein